MYQPGKGNVVDDAMSRKAQWEASKAADDHGFLLNQLSQLNFKVERINSGKMIANLKISYPLDQEIKEAQRRE